MQQPYKYLRMIERRMAVPLVAACQYESVALAFPNRYTPPITRLAHDHKALLFVVCAAIVVHVWFYEEANAQSCPVV